MTSDNQFDVIVIGAGINGAGIARDAAMRGLKVLLLDKGDIGSGTSSWSTRLIHGGLRYLEHGEFGLVRESLRERACLMNIAPHLVRPLKILVPIYQNARRGLWTMRAGMIAYDAFRLVSNFRATVCFPARKRCSRRQRSIGKDCSVPQFTLTPRLSLPSDSCLRTCSQQLNTAAKVLTYARVDKLLVEDGAVRGIEFTANLQNRRYH